MKYKRLGEMMVGVGILTEEQLEDALKKQKGSGKRLGQFLIDEKYITEEQMVETLRMQIGVDFIDLNKARISAAMAALVPRNVARQYRVVPVRLSGDRLYLAMEDPLNFRAIEVVREVSRKRVTPMIAYSRSIDRALSVLYENEGANRAIEQMREERGLTTVEEEVAEMEVQDDSNAGPTVKLVNSIMERSLAENASDIHIEPRHEEMIVRIRVDGRLQEILTIPKDLQSAVISRFKVMADMNIAERRIPQDGRAKVVKPDGTEIDLRLNTLPTIHGEKLVIRVLRRDEGTLTRKGIGITDRDGARFDRILKNTSGMILIVGPTGSGKTSTLYTMIKELNTEDVNMISLEDPVEFQIEGVTQVAINEKVGMTFAAALRSCLRQDPDIICVGEIRDAETAEIALRAAMTGHLVLSTIHTEDAVSAIDRLRDLNVEPYLIAGAVRGIISQRLIRRNCPDCLEEYTPDADILDMIGMKIDPSIKYRRGKGCHNCFESGFRGRIGVFEILTMSSQLRDSIASGANGAELRKAVAATDFVPMIVNGRDLVREGITTPDELLRTVVAID